MNSNTIPEYATADIVLAASLKHKGYKLTRISITQKRGVFTFADVPMGILEVFDLGNLSVEPISFNTEIRTLTTAVKRALNNG